MSEAGNDRQPRRSRSSSQPSPQDLQAATGERRRRTAESRRSRRRLRPVQLISGVALGVVVAVLFFPDTARLRGGRGIEDRVESAPAAALQQPQAGARQADTRREFDGARAFKHLEAQVRFGPRVPNTSGHRACLDYFITTLRPLADSVRRQEFTGAARNRTLKMANVIATWKGRSQSPSAPKENGILLCAHWDTRPTADYEPTPQRQKTPIPGANDGASGVAVLLELARHFKQKPPPVPVMMVLFDGEDYGPDVDRMFFGSRHFAANLPANVPKRGVLLDMIGDRDLVIPQEDYSVLAAPEVVQEVYDTAHALGYGRHFPRRNGGPIEDDHVPLQRKGLKVIDLIDFDYGPGHSWWHTLEDTPDKCSPTSLKVVGHTLLEWIDAQQ